jgi:hypothetical protein
MKTSKFTNRQNKSRSLKIEFAKGFLLVLPVIIIIGADYSQPRNNSDQFRSGSSELQYMEHPVDALSIYEVKLEYLMTDRLAWKLDPGSTGTNLAEALKPETGREIPLGNWMLESDR